MEITGGLYRGAINSPFTKHDIGSIPSKYETILYPRKDINKKGFNTSEFRFVSKPSENPGPGSYIDPVSNRNSSLKIVSDSYSKKGYGNGFASRSYRFPFENYMPDSVPGPGAYKETSSILGLPDELFGNSFDLGVISEKYKQKPSPGFIKHDNKSRTKRLPSLVGPGSYNTHLDEESHKQYQSISSLKNKADRFIPLIKSSRVPGPGEYEIDLEGYKRSNLRNLDMVKCTSSFQLGAGLKRTKVNLYNPFENVEDSDKITPGPGSYSEEEPFKKLAKKQLRPVILSQNLILDRFGKPKEKFKGVFHKIGRASCRERVPSPV